MGVLAKLRQLSTPAKVGLAVAACAVAGVVVWLGIRYGLAGVLGGIGGIGAGWLAYRERASSPDLADTARELAERDRIRGERAALAAREAAVAGALRRARARQVEADRAARAAAARPPGELLDEHSAGPGTDEWSRRR